MTQIYLPFTYFQLITAIQIKTKIFPNETADIVFTDFSVGYDTVIERLKRTGIFRHVFTAKCREALNANTFQKKARRINEMISGQDIRFARDFSDIDCFEYDEYLFFNYNYFSVSLYYNLRKNNPDLICRRFEEGYTSGFDFKMFISRSARIQEMIHWLHKRPSISAVEEMYFYEPESVFFDSRCKIQRIPKLSRADSQLKEILNLLFAADNMETYDKKYIFFEESAFEDGMDNGDMKLILDIADKVGKDNLIVKLHPRTKVNRFSEHGIATNKVCGVPWEVVVMNQDFSDRVFMTIASGSVLTPRILFGDQVKTYMLFKCTDKTTNFIGSNFYRFLDRFKAKYGAQDFFIPEDEGELLKMLEFDNIIRGGVILSKGFPVYTRRGGLAA